MNQYYNQGSAYAGLLSVLLNTLVILQDTNMRTDRIHSLKNLTKLGEADMEAIRQRIIDIENLDDDATWTESGLNELSFYDIELYKDVPGGAVHFIGGAMATLHRINGPHLI
jgi:sulfate adenylyltransferase subunit 1 (EFTu-like GTPase family)